MSFPDVGLHPIDPDIRGTIGPNIALTAHLVVPSAPTAFTQMAALPPDRNPFHEGKIPLDATLFGLVALLEESVEEMGGLAGGEGHFVSSFMASLNAMPSIKWYIPQMHTMPRVSVRVMKHGAPR